MELVEWIAQRNPAIGYLQLADGVLVMAGSLLDDRDRPPNAPERLELAQEHHRVGEVRDIDRRLHVADETVLRDREEGRGTLTI